MPAGSGAWESARSQCRRGHDRVHQVGHLPADLAVSYAAPLAGLAAAGALATGEARLWAKSDGGVVRARVTILIPEASMFGR